MGSTIDRIAVTEHRNSTRRRKHHSIRPDERAAPAADELTWREVRRVLYEELDKVSECYRAEVRP